MLMNSTNSKKDWNCRTSWFLEEKEKIASIKNRQLDLHKSFLACIKKEKVKVLHK
jgi:hypothetical protein